MRKYFNLFPAVLFALSALLVSCEKQKNEINLNLREVAQLISPATGKHIVLNPGANLTERFEWQPTKAEDGSLVMYEVAFINQGGNFDQPLYVIPSDNRGVNPSLSLTHGQLNQLAALAGADFFETANLEWTVLASKGWNVVKAAETRTLSLERPSGFAVIPSDVYITGSATEGGTDLAQAVKMKQLEPGVFEVFTKLVPGEYQIVDGKTGTPTTYSLEPDGNMMRIKLGGTTENATEQVAWIRINFNDINAQIAEVKKMELWYSWDQEFWFDMPYVGNGTWRKEDHTVEMSEVPWGREERHKYRMTYNTGGEDQFHWLNSTFSDPPGQDGQYPSTEAYRTIDMTRNDGDAFNYGWKWDRNYLPNGTVADFWVQLNADAPYQMNYAKN